MDHIKSLQWDLNTGERAALWVCMCVEGHGLVRTVGDGWMVGLGDLVGLFELW